MRKVKLNKKKKLIKIVKRKLFINNKTPRNI